MQITSLLLVQATNLRRTVQFLSRFVPSSHIFLVYVSTSKCHEGRISSLGRPPSLSPPSSPSVSALSSRPPRPSCQCPRLSPPLLPRHLGCRRRPLPPPRPHRRRRRRHLLQTRPDGEKKNDINDASCQGPWIPSHGGLRRLNAEHVFEIQAICERIVKPHTGLSTNKKRKKSK